MNDLIQAIKILNGADLKKINQYVDTLDFQDNTVFGKPGEKCQTNSDIRSSTGVSLDDAHELTNVIHTAMNNGLDLLCNKIWEKLEI